MSRPSSDPPKFLEWLLARISFKVDRDSLVDDLAEEYREKSLRLGRMATRLWYVGQILRLFPSVIGYSFFRSLVMAKNYATIALRNMYRHKVFSFLNIAGLAIGLCLSLVVVKLVLVMYSSDRFHENKDRIYRVIGTEVNKNRAFELATAPMPLAGELEQLPEVELIVRIKSGFGGPTVVGEKKLMTQGYYADEDFFRMFSFELEEGNPERALLEPYSVVLTKELASKLYGNQDPLGRMVSFKDFGDFKITGIMKNVSRLQSHMHFECVASSATLEALEKQGKISPSLRNWKGLNDNYLYFMLEPSVSPVAVDAVLPAIAGKQYPIDDLTFTFSLQPLTKISPGKRLVNALGSTTSTEEPLVLSCFALLIILIACFNYSNLSLAKGLSRAKEVGIRKVIGANRVKIFSQFIGEAVTYALIGLMFSFLLIQFIVPLLYRELRIYLDVESQNWAYIAVLLGVAVFTGVLAGFIPALYLSKFDPVAVLKDITKVRLFSRLTLRQALVVVQFFVSFFFIITTVVLFRQVKFERDFDRGFNPRSILNVELQTVDYETFRQEILQQSAIASVSASAFIPNTGTRWPVPAKLVGQDEPSVIDLLAVDESFLPNLEIDMLAGRNFPENSRLENEKFVVLNERAVTSFGFSSASEALGAVLEFDEGVRLEIIGVTADFITHTISTPIRPVALRVLPKYYGFANLKLASHDRQEFIAMLDDKWKKLEPFRPLAYTYYEELLHDAFTQSRETLQTVTVVTVFTLLIAFFGLLGMVIYDTEAKIKEIGIRKVMGASLLDIVGLISRGFIYLLVLAAVLASPLAWFVNNNLFLKNMAYRIDVGLGIFVVSLGIMFLLGFAIIFSQTVRAASRNPVESLRYE